MMNDPLWESDLPIMDVIKYSRQIILPKVKVDGQKALDDAKVLVVGMGGLGSPVLMYLATTGIRKIGIVDYDSVEIHNLQRQVIHNENTVGTLKTKSAKSFVSALNSTVEIVEHCVRLDQSNVMDIVKEYDVVADCCDDVQLRYIINDACRILNKDLVCASVLRWEGQICVIRKTDACYRCMFPEMKTNASSCDMSGVMGPVCGVVGSMQANEIVKIILSNIKSLNSGRSDGSLNSGRNESLNSGRTESSNGDRSESLNGGLKDDKSVDSKCNSLNDDKSADGKCNNDQLKGNLMILNCINNTFRSFQKNYKICTVCKMGKAGEIRPVSCGIRSIAKSIAWKDILPRLDDFAVVDIRDNDHYRMFRVKGSINIPDVEKHIEDIRKLSKPVIVSCYRGKSSMEATELLNSKGIEAYSSDGGIESFKEYLGFK